MQQKLALNITQIHVDQ